MTGIRPPGEDMAEVTKLIVDELQNDRPMELNLEEIDPIIVAKQLTLIDQEVYSRILPSELYFKRWTTKERENLSPNIHRLTKRFNLVCFLVLF